MRRALGLGGLGVAAFANPLVNLLLIPVVISAAGPAAWSSLAVGQAAGSIATVIVALGWGVTGTVAVARALPIERPALASASISSRLVLGPIVTLATAGLVYILAPVHPLAAAISAASIATVGLDLSWFFIGEGKPQKLLLLDTSPKLAGTLIGVGLLLAGNGVEIFAASQLAGTVTAVLLSSVVASRGAELATATRERRHTLSANVIEQRVPVGIAAATAAYLGLPIVLVGVIAPVFGPLFIISERVARASLLGSTPLIQWLQHSAAGVADIHAYVRRLRRWAIWLSLAYGLVGLAISPLAVKILSANTAQLDPYFAALVGIIVGSGTLGKCLADVILQHLERVKSILIASLAGAGLAVGLVPLGLWIDGARGATAGVAIASVVVVIFELVAINNAIARLDRRRSVLGNGPTDKSDDSRPVG